MSVFSYLSFEQALHLATRNSMTADEKKFGSKLPCADHSDKLNNVKNKNGFHRLK